MARAHDLHVVPELSETAITVEGREDDLAAFAEQLEQLHADGTVRPLRASVSSTDRRDDARSVQRSAPIRERVNAAPMTLMASADPTDALAH